MTLFGRWEREFPRFLLALLASSVYAVVFALGGCWASPVGVGMVIAHVGAGISMQAVFGVLRLNREAVKQRHY